MVKRFILALFFIGISGIGQSAGYSQGLSLFKLRNKAISAYKTCKKRHTVKSCKRALTLFEQADALVPGNPKITSRIRALRRMISRLNTPWWKRKYRNIFVAVKAGDLKACRAFLDHGVAPNTRDPKGRTPLHYAARGGYVKIARLLHDNNGRLDLRDNDGKTPIDMGTAQIKAAFRARLIVHSTPGALVTVDGVRIGKTDGSGTLTAKMDGGSHAISVQKKGFQTVKTRVSAKWAADQVVTMVLTRVAPVAKPLRAKKSKPGVRVKHTKKASLPRAVTRRVKKKTRTWAYVTLFSGIAVAGLGGGMTGLAIHERSNMNNARTTADLNASTSRIKTYNAVAITSYVLGAGLIGTGIYLFVRPQKQSRHTSVLPLVGNKVVGAVVEF